ncbi:unnamed protein product [Blepharisma stoltei]|uniref:RCC1-like domain-containing protein n=1 Tax=Blepharisma stoltei TaxID=1481888 RepID=A0AAU9K9B1_9CILI|nr:unnamed protein product [Blepharisma stoltei]
MEGYTEVFAWGLDNYGQLGLGGKVRGKTYTIPRFCSYNVVIRDISCGEDHSAFISLHGHVYSMGSNADGRLGIGDKSIKMSSSPCLVEGLTHIKAASISCGWGHTVAVTEQGTAYSWGLGEFGALGISTLESQWSPTEMEISEIIRIKQVSCGSRHTSIIGEKDFRRILLTCGSGEAGQLGTGKREKELIPVTIQTGEDVKQVSSGVYHTVYVTVNGRVFAMGGNSFGQLGMGDKKSYSRPERVSYLDGVFIEKVSCGQHSAAISDKGHLYVWGTGAFGEFLVPQRFNSGIGPMKDVSIGGCFGVALDSSFNTYIWGSNSNGELGLGDIEPRAVPTLVYHLKDKQVRHISSGGSFFLGLGSDIDPPVKMESRTRKSTPERIHDLRYVQAQREASSRKIDTSFSYSYKNSEENSFYKAKKSKENKYSAYARPESRRKGTPTRKRKSSKEKGTPLKERNGSVEREKRPDLEYPEIYNPVKLERVSNNNPFFASNEARRKHSLSGADFEKEPRPLSNRPRSTTPFNEQPEGNVLKPHEFEQESSFQRSEDPSRDVEREYFRPSIQETQKGHNNREEYGMENRGNNIRQSGLVQELEYQLELKDREIEKLNLEINHLSSQFYESKVDIERISRSKASDNSKIEDIQRENEDLKLQLRRSQQDNEQLQLKANSIDRDYHMVDTQYILKVKTLEGQLEAISVELEKSKAYSQQLEAKVTELNRASLYSQQLSGNLIDAQAEIKTLRDALEEEKTIKESLERNIEDMSMEMFQLRSEIEQTAIRAKEAESQIKGQATENSYIRKNYEETKMQMQSENMNLKKNLEDLRIQLQNAMEENMVVKKSNDEIKQQLNYVDGGSKFLREENLRLKRSTEELQIMNKNEAQRHEVAVNRLMEEIDLLKSKLESESQSRIQLEFALKSASQEKTSLDSLLKLSQSQMNDEVLRYRQSQNKLETDQKKLYTELEQMKRENMELRSSFMSKVQENTQLSSSISNFDFNIKKSSEEICFLRQESIDLKSKLEFFTNENQEIKARIQNLLVENDALQMEANESKTQIEKLIEENEHLQSIYINHKAQTGENVATYEKENRILKDNMNDMKYEIEKLQQQINEKLEIIDNISAISRDWEERFNSSVAESQNLQKEYNNLEAKNRHLFETLEKELQQRAKEYKERTLNLLNTPNKSTPYVSKSPIVQSSPAVYHSTEFSKLPGPSENQERLGNCAEKLLEALNESPLRDSRDTSPNRGGADLFNERQKISALKDLSLTPQRQDLNSRISALMQSRAKLRENGFNI